MPPATETSTAPSPSPPPAPPAVFALRIVAIEVALVEPHRGSGSGKKSAEKSSDRAPNVEAFWQPEAMEGQRGNGSSLIANTAEKTDPEDLDVTFNAFTGSAVPRNARVPILRVFGSTPLGQRCCLHIHGLFPYFFVSVPSTRAEVDRILACGRSGNRDASSTADSSRHASSSLSSSGEPPTMEQLQLLCYQLAVSLEQGLELTRGVEADDIATGVNEQSSAHQQHYHHQQQQQQQQQQRPRRRETGARHVLSVSLARGVPFYGLHAFEQLFLKIELFAPSSILKSANMLRSGSLLGTRFDCYEAHIPYIMQFLIDYNLYGMDFIYLSRVRFRLPLPALALDASLGQMSTLARLHAEHVSQPCSLSEVSVSQSPSMSLQRAAELLFCSLGAIDPECKAHTIETMSLPRQTTCALECDCVGEDIINPLLSTQRRLETGSFSQTTSDIWQGRASLNVPSLQNLWNIERDRRRAMAHATEGSTNCGSTPSCSIVQPPVPQRHGIHEMSTDELLLQHIQQRLQEAISVEARVMNELYSPSLGVTPRDQAMFAIPAAYSQQPVSRLTVSALELQRNSTQFNQAFSQTPIVPLCGLEDDSRTSKPRAGAETKPTDTKPPDSLAELEDIFKWMQELVVPDNIQRNDSASDQEGQDILASNSARESLDIMSQQHEVFDDERMPQLDGKNDVIELRRLSHDQQAIVHSEEDIESSHSDSDARPTCATNSDAIGDEIDAISDASDGENKHQWSVRRALKLSCRVREDRSLRQVSTRSKKARLRRTDDVIRQQQVHDADFDDKSRDASSTRVRFDLQLSTSSESSAGEDCDHQLPFNAASMKSDQPNSSRVQRDGSSKFETATPGDECIFDSSGQNPLFTCLSPLLLVPMRRGSRLLSSSLPLGPNSLRLGSLIRRNPQAVQPTTPRHASDTGLIIQHPIPATVKVRPRQQQLSQQDVSMNRRLLTPAMLPPLCSQVVAHCNKHTVSKPSRQHRSQVEQLTQQTTQQKYGFRLNIGSPTISPRKASAERFRMADIATSALAHSRQHLTSISLECFSASNSQRELETRLADPAIDQISVIAFRIFVDDDVSDGGESALGRQFVWYIAGPSHESIYLPSSVLVRRFESELGMLHALVEFVRLEDPDLLLGYEVQCGSWGYLIDRSETLGFDLRTELGRVISDHSNRWSRQNTSVGPAHKAEEYARKKAMDLSVSGRHILNAWRLMRNEINHTSYTLSASCYHVLHRRVASFPQRSLNLWWMSSSISTAHSRSRVAAYTLERASLCLQLVLRLQLIERTSEFARLYGIEFFSVLSRGSQYQVEAVMLRITKQRNYVCLSPSKQEVVQQRAPEVIPLVMEPESAFYTCPVIVLDFQSLYPSVMIAYNMCYSTCLGKIPTYSQHDDTSISTLKKFGVSTLELPPGLIGSLRPPSGESATQLLDHLDLENNRGLFVAPNEVMFLQRGTPFRIGDEELPPREGVLPAMLNELLQTRIMIKRAIKDCEAFKDDNPQQRIVTEIVLRSLNAKQLGLKLLSNVVYGYTSASFSGRMPCIDIADAIVSTGRDALDRAIKMVHDDSNTRNSTRWGCARVVYGDTDSMFVAVPGAVDVRDAFRIGAEIAKAVSADNPAPMELKLEKVYSRSVLVTKKRYAGYMFESPDQAEPIFEAKGIETVRRDGCPLVSKTLKKALCVMFETCELSAVKTYVQEQMRRVVQGRVSLADLIFAKEVRLGSYARGTLPPPAALVAASAMATDHRAEPRYGERIKYVVVAGDSSARLADLVVAPDQLVREQLGVGTQASTVERVRDLAPYGIPVKSLGGSSAPRTTNATYYVVKQLIPVLQRILGLAGADVMAWFSELPKSQRTPSQFGVQTRSLGSSVNSAGSTSSSKARTLDHFYRSLQCASCGVAVTLAPQVNTASTAALLLPKDAPLCHTCRADPDKRRRAAGILHARVSKLCRELLDQQEICYTCTGDREARSLQCESLDCPVLFERARLTRERNVATSTLRAVFGSFADGQGW